MAGTRSKVPSEYGGTPGRIQGEMGAAEEARLMRATEPTDVADDATAALARELLMEGRDASNIVRGDN